MNWLCKLIGHKPKEHGICGGCANYHDDYVFDGREYRATCGLFQRRTGQTFYCKAWKRVEEGKQA